MKSRLPRKLKKKYKKEGIWRSYLKLRYYSNSNCLRCGEEFYRCECIAKAFNSIEDLEAFVGVTKITKYENN